MRWVPAPDPLPRLLALGLAALAVPAAAVLHRRPDLLLGLARCPLRETTGLPCPTCGGTHAAVALARLDLGAAVAANPLVVAGAAALLAWVAWAALATARPGWRRRPALGAAGRRAARAAAAGALAATWIWEIIRLR